MSDGDDKQTATDGGEQAPFRTTELALAAKLYREGCTLDDFVRRRVRNRPVTEFVFWGVDPQLLDDFRTGRDGIAQYENCRKMLMRIVDDDSRRPDEVGARHADTRGAKTR